MHGRHDEIGAAHHVTTGKNLRVAGLVRSRAHRLDEDAAAVERVDLVVLEPLGRIGPEPERDDDGIGGKHCFRAINRLGAATAIGAGRAHLRLDDPDARDVIVAEYFDRLAVEEKRDALFFTVRNLAARPGHVLLVAAVRAGHARGALANGGAVAVHARVAAAEHDDPFILEIDVRRIRFIVAELAIRVADEVGQRLDNAGQVLARESAPDVLVGAHAEKHRIVLFDEVLERFVLADARVEHELHAHAFKQLAAPYNDVLLEFEGRDAVGQQAADFGVGIVNDRANAVACQHIRRGEARRTRADDADNLAGVEDIRHVRPPALGDSLIGNVFLDAADRDRTVGVLERAGAFAKPVLRTDTTADLGQRVRLVRQLGRLEELALLDQFQPVRDVVVNRALPLAVRVAAVEAAPRLRGSVGAVIRPVDLAIVRDAVFGRFLFGVLARHLQELQWMLAHYAACLSDSISVPSCAAFGLTSQNFGRKDR